MASVERIDAALEIYFARAMHNVHTNTRGVISEVGLDGPTASVKPNYRIVYDDGTVDELPMVHDIPIQMPSANGGKARITMPIKPGDPIGIAFAERNEADNSDKTTHGVYPAFGVTGVSDGGRPIDPDNIIIENEKAIFTIKPTGEIVVTSGAGTITLLVSGDIDANGAKITKAGRVITKAGVDVDSFYAEYQAHRHGGVSTGPATTGTPQ